MVAKDYLGCIQSNSGQSPGVSGPTKDSASNLGREKCFDTGVCIAQSGQDQLGLAKVIGWLYRYNAANNTVNYWNPEAKRVPHKGQPARYVAATPGYYREISPANTTCTPHLKRWALGCRDSRNCRCSSQVFLRRGYRLPRFDPCHLPSRQIKRELVKVRG